MLFVFGSSSDWFIRSSISAMMGHSTCNYFGFGFTTSRQLKNVLYTNQCVAPENMCTFPWKLFFVRFFFF